MRRVQAVQTGGLVGPLLCCPWQPADQVAAGGGFAVACCWSQVAPNKDCAVTALAALKFAEVDAVLDPA